jgi:hypothetical protein
LGLGLFSWTLLTTDIPFLLTDCTTDSAPYFK